MPERFTNLPHEIDHIRSQKHEGPTTLDNLCFSCSLCNAFKGSDVSAFTPDTNEFVRLFSPRADTWHDHFEWHGPVLVGKTAIGKATIHLLRINSVSRVNHRGLLLELGELPPKPKTIAE